MLSRLTRVLSVTAGCGVLLCSAAQAQTLRTEPIPRILAEPLELTGGTLQRLALPLRNSGVFEFSVVLGGESRTIVATPHSLRGEDFRIIEYRKDGTERELAAPAPTTYRGLVVGLPGATAAINLYQGQLSGIVLIDDGIWAIQPATEGIAWLPRNAHVVYRQDQLQQRSIGCPVTESPEFLPGSLGGAPGAARNAPLVAEIAAELEPRFRTRWGGIAGSVNQATAILNAVDLIYTRDIDVTLKITTLVTREAGYSTNSTTVLSAMRSIWNARALDIKRDVAHLFMGSTGSGVIGIAYLASVCGSSQYSVSWHTGSLTSRAAVTAHELGHSFSAGHCDNNAQCFIMCSFIGGCSGNITKFAPVSINVIGNFAATRMCLN